MEPNNSIFASLMLLLPILVLASADYDYGKSQLKPDTPKYTYPNLPTTKPPVVPKKEEYGSYKNTYDPNTPTLPKPDLPKGEEYKKSYEPKAPTLPKFELPKGEGYKKSYEPKAPSVPKPELPKGEGYKKSYEPKAPTLPKFELPKGEGYKKSYEPKTPSVPKPELPKGEGYKKSYEPKTPTLPKPELPKGEEYKKSYEPKTPTLPKPVIPKQAEHGAYYGPKMPTPKKEILPKVPEHPKNIAVQGLIYCKDGSKFLPLKGAIARVTCLAVHKNGYESAPFSFSSCPADDKGYFLAKILASKFLKGDDEEWEITECKTFLEKSPWSTCNVPQDTNGGIHGAHLTFSRLVNGYRLSSVGPFLYKPSPKEGY